MATKIDWYYHRANCETCAKSQAFLTRAEVSIAEQTDARKVRYDRAAALTLARGASQVIAARGKTVLTFDMKKDPPDDDTLARALLGPHGNLRAPAVKIGGRLYIGFAEEAWRELAIRR